MKIRVNEFWLCEDGELAPNSLRIDSRRDVQVARRLRAAAAVPYGRGNAIKTISFSVVREHDSIREAEAYLLEHEAEIPTSGVVELRCHDDNGAESVFYFVAAEIETVSAAQVGLSTEHSYVLVGGAITTEKPT